MRIAFLGKGGSGKTTMSALFALYADEEHYRVGLLDVDVNSHTSEVLGVETPELSASDTMKDIQAYLAGDNSYVKASEFLNTTPPGHGSGRWTLDADNYITKKYSAPIGETSCVLTTGSYKQGEVGHGCHHGTQYIAENILSHAQLAERDVLVVDSVAGNDAFANSLYMQDVLVLVVKPEREGIKVFERFYELAKHAGVADRVYVVGNLVATDKQRAFLEEHIPAELLLGVLTTNEHIIDSRLDDEPLATAHIRDEERAVFAAVLKKAHEQAQSPAERYDELLALHRRVAAESWVAGAYRTGLEDQIDPEYKP